MSYRELDHTADILLEITGTSIHELFCEAARALMETLYPPNENFSFSSSNNTSTADIITTIPISVCIESEEKKDEETDAYASYELLVQAFLSELLFLTDTEYIVFSVFDIVIEQKRVYGTVQGVPFDPELHGGGIGVKGISYSDLAIKRRGNEYILTIIYDI